MRMNVCAAHSQSDNRERIKNDGDCDDEKKRNDGNQSKTNVAIFICHSIYFYWILQIPLPRKADENNGPIFC